MASASVHRRPFIWPFLAVSMAAISSFVPIAARSSPSEQLGDSSCHRSCTFHTRVKGALTIQVEPWGEDSLRVRIPLDSSTVRDDLPSPFVPPPNKSHSERLEKFGEESRFHCESEPESGLQGRKRDGSAGLGAVTNGNLRADVGPDGLLTFTRISDGKVVLQESRRTVQNASVSFAAKEVVHGFHSSSDEQIFGFGEHQNGHLNQKGQHYLFHDCVDYSISHGGAICLPVITGRHSSSNAGTSCLDYGFLWGMPGYGSVSFNETETVWQAIAAHQLDYFVTVAHAGSTGAQCNMDISSHYVDATGHTPVLPEWAAGYWHSKNRYKSQGELLSAAKEFHDRQIPVDIIVIDYLHWRYMGDWAFDPARWPDPETMVNTLTSYNMRTMVSVWPYSMVKSTSFATINSSNYEARNGTSDVGIWWPNGVCHGPCFLYDPSQVAARQYVWSRVQEGYATYGIHVFWLDSTEPPVQGPTPAGTHFDIGYAEEVGMTFPYYHCRTVHEGQRELGQPFLMLLRSAWAGQQRYGTVLWSGDTTSTFETLKNSIAAGLNIQLSGISWWTTDIGGYSGGKPSDPTFNELIVRWFQYGLTCPIFRQHGVRPTEPWELSNESYALVVSIIKIRNLWRPYVMDAMKRVNVTGLPVQRPLWYDFPEDANTWQIEDQYMFGSELMAAPVYVEKARQRSVYFPNGTDWQNYFTGKVFNGGQHTTVNVPLNETALFKRVTGSAWPNNVPVPPLSIR